MRRFRQNMFLTYYFKVTGFLPMWVFLKPSIRYMNSKFKPGKQPFILVSNHLSLLDMPLYWIRFFGTNLRFTVAEVMFNKGRYMNWMLHRMGCIKVDRNAYDFSFIEDSIDCLDSGESVGIFPSSRLPVDGKPFPFKPSVAIIALESDAMILPCYTDGNYGLFKRAHVMIGDPVKATDLLEGKTDLPKTEQLKLITENLEKLVDSLGAELKRRLGR